MRLPIADALQALPRVRLSPLDAPWAEIFRRSEPWPAVVAALEGEGEWWLIRDVPLSVFASQTPDAGDYVTDGDEDGVRRCEVIAVALGAGDRPWPLIVEGDFVLDGYHRLAVVSDHGDESIDVIWTPQN